MARTPAPFSFGSDRVTLKRIFAVSDIGGSLWCRWLNDRRVTKYLGSGGRWTRARLAVWLSARVGSSKAPTHRHTRMYAILLGPTPVGTLKLEGVERGGCANLGVMIGESKAWASGIATLALRAACEAAKKAGCASVWAGILLENKASWQAFAEAGFIDVAVQTGTNLMFLTEQDVPSMVCRRIAAWTPTPLKIAVMRRL